MATANLEVQELDFEQVKENLIDFLRAQDQFKDYDFEGSSMNILIDLLAYNTHYMGVYAHMLSNETFIDSATSKSSMAAKAKFVNYLPGSKKSSRAEVSIAFDVGENGVNEPDDKKIVLERGTVLDANNNATDNRKFVITDDIYIYNQAELGYDYKTIDNVMVYEGTYESVSSLFDTSLTDQRFIIRDKNIDIDTLAVRVYNNAGSTSYENYKRADDFMSINKSSKVYFVSLNADDYYEIYFGNDVYGQSPKHGNVVEMSYVACNGVSGNFASKFLITGGYNFSGRNYPATVTTEVNSYGGMEAEDVEDLRFNIPYHYRRQNRCVTVDDYKNILLSEYRNINSINVWGGEDNEPITFGKVYICIKPKYGETLSDASKQFIIKDILQKYNTVTIEPEIVDPEYLYLDIDFFIRYNPLITNSTPGQVRSAVNKAVIDYNTNVLNRFDGYYSNSDLLANIKKSDESIMTSYSKIKLEKRIDIALGAEQTYFIDYVNAVVPETFRTDYFEFRARKSYIVDDGAGNLKMYYLDGFLNEYKLYPEEFFGTIDYTKGLVRLTDFYITDLYDTNKLYSWVTPVNPDFFTKRNNVVIIDDYTMTINEDFSTESNKV